MEGEASSQLMSYVVSMCTIRPGLQALVCSISDGIVLHVVPRELQGHHCTLSAALALSYLDAGFLLSCQMSSYMSTAAT